jgi:anti-sigma factor (TIGR02949 family)
MTETPRMSCEQALARLFEYLDHELGEQETLEMQEHLERCRACFSRAEFERALKQALRDTGKEAAPPELQERIGKLLADY